MLRRLKELRTKWAKLQPGPERDEVSALIDAYEAVLKDMQCIVVKGQYCVDPSRKRDKSKLLE